MTLQQIIEQYITFQQSLGTAFLTEARILRAFGAVAAPKHASPMCALDTWMPSWARPGP
jgi:hypothetical protein